MKPAPGQLTTSDPWPTARVGHFMRMTHFTPRTTRNPRHRLAPRHIRPPGLRVTLHTEPDHASSTVADRQLGTLTPDPTPNSVPVHAGLHFTPAWDPNEEAQASVLFLNVPSHIAQQAAHAQVLEAAVRRAACGVTWHHQRLTARAYNARGELLACRTITGLPSDQAPDQRTQIEHDLREEAILDAQDWAILGLN